MLFLLFLLFSCSVLTFAQGGMDDFATGRAADRIQSSFNAISPNVASLGVFGDIPISNYTGQPQVNIPLFNLQSEGISIPVGLDYNVSMVKPDTHPGWLGLGWGLSVAGGGVITRKRNDMPDEGNRNFYDISQGILGALYPSGGFYYSAESRSSVQNDNWESTTPETMIASQRDTEPDEFSFKFMGFSGKFFLDHTGKWQVRSEQPIKVEFDGGYLLPPFPVPSSKEAVLSNPYFRSTLCYLSTLQVFKGFTLTDDKGIKYIFGGSNDAIEYSLNYTDQHIDDWVAGSWFLTKIVMPGGREVNFTYERGELILDLQVMGSYSKRTAYVNGAFSCYANPPAVPIGGQVISPVYLSSIVNSQGQSLTFYSSKSSERYYNLGLRLFRDTKEYFYLYGQTYITTVTGDLTDQDRPSKLSWRKLDSISLSSNSKRLKSFKFLYNDNLGGFKSRRLMLLQAVPVSASGTADSPYDFRYSSTFDGDDYFSDYLSEKTDHWGYFSNQQSSYVTLKESPVTYYQSRNGTEDLNVLHSNLLTKITYPTKGTSILKYERGEYHSSLDSTRQGLTTFSVNQYGGGPRIKEMIDNDESGQPLKKKSFFYVKGYTAGADPGTLISSGILSGIPKYDYSYREAYDTKFENTGGVQDHIEVDYSLKTSNPILPLNDEFFYNPVGYSEVVELEESLKTGRFENGYTIYKYTSFDDGHFDDPASGLYPAFYPFYPISSRAFERGRLKSQEIYNSSGRLLEQKNITWGNREINEQNPRDQFARSYHIKLVKLCSFTSPIGGAQFTSTERGAYRLYHYPFRPLKEELTKYTLPGEAPLVFTINYKYNDYKLLSEKMVDGSGTEQLITRYHYPFDVTGPVWAKSLMDGTFPTMSSAISFPYSSMVVKHNIGVPVETIDLVKRNGAEQIRGVKLTKYKGIVVGGSGEELAVPAADYRLKSAVPLGTYRPHTINYEEGKEVNLELDGGLTAVTSYLDYDQKANLLSAKNANLPGSVTGSVRYLWGYQQNYQVGEVSGAQFGEVGYTSFEDGGETWKGFLDRRGLIINATAPTGNVAYGVNLGLTKTALDPASRYTFTYWYSDGSVVNVTGAGSPEVIRSYNGWTQVKQEISGVSELSMNGNGLIDELRFYPAGAKMVTCTYLPGIGISSKTDEKGKVTYYEYDEFQRLKLVRDQNGYILNSYTYHFKP